MKRRSSRLVMLPASAFIVLIVAWVLVTHVQGGPAAVVQDGGEGTTPATTCAPSGPVSQADPIGGDAGAGDAASGQEPAGEEGPDDGECPIDPGAARFISAAGNPAGRAWRYRSDEPMATLAQRMLGQLEGDGWALVDASQADLLGEAWNCVAMDASGSRVLLITITPETWGGVRDGDVSSLVSIVRLAG